jgi:Asp-tRNA(Asn)/Glu-tRNA(Gln) amidotransferase A subunit family amidase
MHAEHTSSGVRPVVLQISALSIDGRICESGSEFEAWAGGIVDEERDAWMVDSLWRAGVHIMGATTFRDMSAWWPTSTATEEPSSREPWPPPTWSTSTA